MSEKHFVGKTEELEGDGSRIIKEIRGVEIAVFEIDGEYHAAANYCVHQAGPLCEGGLTGQITVGDDGWEWEYDDTEKYIVCPWHSWKFDLSTGDNVNDSQYKVPLYDVEVEDDDVYVVK